MPVSDSPELAAIRARDADSDLWLAADDRRTLLKMLDDALKERDEAREGDEESSKLMAHYRDHCLRLEKERDEARAEIQRLNMEMTAYREKLTPADAAAMKRCADCAYWRPDSLGRALRHFGHCDYPLPPMPFWNVPRVVWRDTEADSGQQCEVFAPKPDAV